MIAERKYKDDYELSEVPRKNGKGTRKVAVYRGDYWRDDLPDHAYRPFLRRQAALLFGIGILYALIGFLPSGAMGSAGPGTPYVVLPYIAFLLPFGMCIGKLVMLAQAKRELERKAYELWVVRRMHFSKAMLVLSGSLFLGGIIYTILHKCTVNIVHDVLLTASAGAICAFCWGIIRAQNGCHYSKLDK